MVTDVATTGFPPIVSDGRFFRDMKRSVLFLVPSIVVLALNSPAATGDWPQWRGPNRDGISTETGLLKDWPAGGPRLVWKATGLGKGFSTGSVAGGRIYSEGVKGDARAVGALIAADGKVGCSAPPG